MKTPSWRFWLLLALAVATIKWVAYLRDSELMFFLGDSATYLYSASTGWVPPDRSYVFGKIIRLVTLKTTHLELLVPFQVTVSAFSCLLAGFILRYFLACSRWVVVAAVLLCAIDPLQLLYERYVMAESVSLASFALFLVAVLFYLRNGRWWLLLLAAVLAEMTGALRNAYLPVELGVAMLAILYCSVFRIIPDRGGSRPLWLRLGISAAHFTVFLVVVFQLYSFEARVRSYTDKGFFLMSAFGPILAEPDFPHGSLMTEFMRDLPEVCDLTDIDKRQTNLWWDICLSGRVKAHFATRVEAANYAKQVAIGALLHDPVGVLKLGWRTWLMIWDDARLSHILSYDRGSHPFPPPSFTKQLHDDYGVEIEGWHLKKTPTNKYFFAARWWYRWVALSPLLLVLWWLATWRALNPYSMVIAASSVALLLVVTIPITMPTVRFYHAISWLSFIGLASSVDQLLGWHRHRPFPASD